MTSTPTPTPSEPRGADFNQGGDHGRQTLQAGRQAQAQEGLTQQRRECLTCTHGALRDPMDDSRDRTVRAMARLGWVNCTISPLRAKFHPRRHKCPKFAQADEKTAEARRRWAAAQEST